MKKIRKVLLTMALMGALSCAFALMTSCDGDKIDFTFETNGANAMEGVSITQGEEYVLPVPTREGYRFDGWFTSSNFAGAPVTKVVATESVTYYAKWTQVYAVNLDLNGGTLGTTTIYLAQGENIYNAVKDLKPTKNGLTFGAWFNGNNELSSMATMKANTLNLTAQYKVSYSVEIYLQNLEDDDYTKLDTIVGSEYVGKTFTSTQNQAGFTEVTEDKDALTKVLSANATENVFVHKFDRNTYTITFNPHYPNGETGEMISITAKYGEMIDVPSDATKYQAKGHLLLGWSTDVNATSVEYPVDLNPLLYNKDSSAEGAAKYLVERTATLYGVWQEGYRDMFNGDDTIYYMGGENAEIYLCRANVYFKGTYDVEQNEFYFFNVENDLVITGRLYNNGKYVYYDDTRAKVNSTLYSTDKGIVPTEKIRFDAYNEIKYIVYEEGTDGAEVGREIDTSVGSYEIAANGDYVATFTSGNLKGQSISFIISTITGEDGGEKSVFQVRNADEYQIGRIILVGIRRNDAGTEYVIGSTDLMFFELDGFGTAKFNSSGRVSTYSYSTDENGNLLLKDGNGNVVETIRLVDIPGYKDVKGYVVYNEEMDNTFDLGDGNTLTLDGLYSAVYVKDGKTINSYYRSWTNPMGGTTISIIDASTKTEHKFLLTPKKEVVEDETIDTFAAKEVLNTYAEYYYKDGDGVYYAPMVVIDETAVGKASLYGYTADKKYVKVSEGRYELIKEGEYKGLYQYIRETSFDAVDVYNEPVDLVNVQSFMFSLDTETTEYNVNYWYLSNDGNQDTTYFVDYQNTDLTSEATLKLVGGFAFYRANADANAVIGTYTKTDNLLKITVTDATYYFTMDWENNKFTVLEYAPYKAYLKNSDGTYSQTIYLDFDGRGGAVYAVDGVLIEGTITNVQSGGVGKQTVFGEDIYKFTPGDPALADKAFEYVDVTIGSKACFTLLDTTRTQTNYYSSSTSKTQGSLTLDGFTYWAKFDDYESEYEGLYHFEGNIVVLKAGGRTFYFDFLADDSFTVRGQEYGSYALYENQYSNGLFVELDGYGKLTVFQLQLKENSTEEYERVNVSVNGSYEIENDVYTFTYGTGEEAKAYVCILNGSVYEGEDGKNYQAFAISKELRKEIFVNATDWSVLILDEFGNATKCDKDGEKEEGRYTFITDTLLYFINHGQSNACIYNYNEETGEATPIKLAGKSYYTEDLKSLYFSEFGFAIFNGAEDDLHFYTYLEDGDENPENNEVIIYSRAKGGEEANQYGFTFFNFGTLNDTIVYNDETYYENDGNLITFVRSDSTEIYPLLGEDIKYFLTDLRFSPSGGAEFEVSGQAKLIVEEADKEPTTEWMPCTITRQIVDGVPEMYVTIGSFYRYYVTATYTDTTKSYKVESAHRMQTLDAYFYLSEYFYTYMYSGATAAEELENRYGTIKIEIDYETDGSMATSVASLQFGEATEFFDMDGNRISCDEAKFTVRDDGFSIAEFEAADGYTYQVHFGIYRYPYMTMYGYYVHAVVRMQTIEVGDYNLTVGRVVASEETEEDQPIGEVYTLALEKDGKEIACDEFFYAGEKLTFVARERDEDGYVTKATYYTVDLVENENSSIEEVIPTYQSATISSAEATIMCEKDPTDPNANYKGKDRYVEMVNGEIKILYLIKNKRYAETCTYDENSGIYTVKTKDNRTYYVKVVGENVAIADNLEELKGETNA